jgi:hypothetical protein
MITKTIIMFRLKDQKSILEAANRPIKKKKQRFFYKFWLLLTKLFTIK